MFAKDLPKKITLLLVQYKEVTFLEILKALEEDAQNTRLVFTVPWPPQKKKKMHIENAASHIYEINKCKCYSIYS